MPRVSVLMPMFNAREFVGDSIRSVLSQTFEDFELIIVDDASTDGSDVVVAEFFDKRVRYLKNAHNLGLAGARNVAIQAADCEYLAWLDADDLSLPDRLEKQQAAFDADANLALCGTWVRHFGVGDNRVRRLPTDSDVLRGRMLFDNPIVTSSVMLRRKLIQPEQLAFNQEYPPAEDYELWSRIAAERKIINIPEVLTLYRIHSKQASALSQSQQLKAVGQIQVNLLIKLGLVPTEKELAWHSEIGPMWRFPKSATGIKELERWLLKIVDGNARVKLFPTVGLNAVVAERWFYAIREALPCPDLSSLRYSKSRLGRLNPKWMRNQLHLVSTDLKRSIGIDV